MKPGRKRTLIDKRATPFLVEVPHAEAIDAMRGPVPRNRFIRQVAKRFLASDVTSKLHPDFPDYEMPESAKKDTIYFEMPGALSSQIEARKAAMGIGRVGTFLRIALIWHLQQTASRTAAISGCERLAAAGGLRIHPQA